jgi:hypothetical protein
VRKVEKNSAFRNAMKAFKQDRIPPNSYEGGDTAPASSKSMVGDGK